MKSKCMLVPGAVLAVCLTSFVAPAVKPADFTARELDEIWKELWPSDSPQGKQPKLETLPAQWVREHTTGKWTMKFGPLREPVTLAFGTNQTVEISGQAGETLWKKTGQWRENPKWIVLFMAEEQLPVYVFRAGQKDCVFDPWSPTLMSELQIKNSP